MHYRKNFKINCEEEKGRHRQRNKYREKMNLRNKQKKKEERNTIQNGTALFIVQRAYVE
jgi:hypothetical protein